MGAPRGVPRKRYDSAFRAEVERLHREGFNRVQIGRHLDCSRQTLGKILNAAGLPPHTSAKPKPKSEDWKQTRVIEPRVGAHGAGSCACGCGHPTSGNPGVRFKPGHQLRKTRLQPSPRVEASLDEPMSGHCGRCGDWTASGPARAVIRAYAEHRERCRLTVERAAA